MKSVLVIFGTRPEAIKMAPIIARLREHTCFNPIVCFAGQHSREMVDPILDLFSIQPDVRLLTLRRGQSLSAMSAALITEITPIFRRFEPDAVLVQGDTTSAFVGALSAFYHRAPIGHVEAGLRTCDLTAPFPEEANRQMISRLSDFHFAPTTNAANALYCENVEPHRVRVTGNTVIDALLGVVARNATDGTNALSNLSPDRDSRRRYILATLHRREVFGKIIRNMLAALADIAARHPELDVILLRHPNPEVQAAIVDVMPIGAPNLRVIPPQPYREFVDLMARAHLILSDSGGVQEEAPSLNRPVLVLRDRTEREEGVEAGCLVQVGTDRRRIVDMCENLLIDEKAYARIAAAPNPYGDGKASRRICVALAEYLNA